MPGNEEKGQEPQGIGPPRHRRAEGKEPGRIDEQVREVPMDELVRYERGADGDPPPGRSAAMPLRRAGMKASTAVNHALSSAGSTQRKR